MFETVRHAVQRHPVGAFLVVTFGYSFGIDLIGYSFFGQSPSQLLLLPRAWGPLVGAVAVTWALGDSVRELVGQVTEWRVSPRWYLLALLIPVVVGEADLLVYVAAGVPVQITDSPLSNLIVPFLLTLFVAGALEEFGWRGFAQPRLQESHSAGLVAVGIGLAWAAWHLPFFVLFDYGAFELGTLPLYVVDAVGFSIIYAWLYNQTGGSLVIVMLGHAAHNMSGVTVPATTPTGLTAQVAEFAPDASAGLLALGLFVAFGHDRLSQSSLPAGVLGKPESDEQTPEATCAN